MIGLGLGTDKIGASGIKGWCDYAYVSLMLCSPSEVEETPASLTCNKNCYEQPVKLVFTTPATLDKKPTDTIYLGEY